MITPSMRGTPIDLYYFMSCLDSISDKNSILITDAGSNYYIGGQAFSFDNNTQKRFLVHQMPLWVLVCH